MTIADPLSAERAAAVGGAWQHEEVTTSASAAMIGRDAELVWLDGLLGEAEAGMPRTVVVGGEAGIGKSRLIREFASRVGSKDAAPGPDTPARVIVGQCVDLGAVAAPYAPIKAALRSLVSDIGAERALETVGPGRAAFVALLPELAESGVPGDVVPAVAGPGASGQLHEAVAVLLETVSREQPVVLVVEDLHWIDPASLGLLRFLVRALTASRVMLLLSYRSEDVTRGHPLRPFLAELERDRWVDRRELSRLSRDQVRELAASLVGAAPDEALLDTLFRRSDGVPFFVEEVVGLDGCNDDGQLPDTLRDLLLARYERLSDEAQQLLRLIATGGVRVGHPLLTRVFRGGDDELDEAAREAVLGGVLVVDGEEYGFRHALVREAILADILPGERARFHARYAEAYEALAAAGGRRLAAEISYHWLGANDAMRAFPATVQAMREARAASAFASAAQLGERALALWDVVDRAPADGSGDEAGGGARHGSGGGPGGGTAARIAGMSRMELMGRTASHLRNAGENDRSLAVIKAALAECPRDDPNYPRLLRDRALTLGSDGRPGSIPLLLEALDVLGPDGSAELRASVRTSLAGRYMIDGQLQEAVEMAQTALELAESIGAPRLASVATNIAAVGRAHLEDPVAAAEQLERAKQLAEGDGSALLRYWVNASDLYNLLGDYELAIELAEEGLARARATGLERSSGVILASNAVDPLFALGRWQRGLDLIERALALDPPEPFKIYLWRAEAWAELWRGDLASAGHVLRTNRAAMNAVGEVELQTRQSVGRVATEIALANGDVVTAWREAVPLLDEHEGAIAGYGLPYAWALARTIAAARSGHAAANAEEVELLATASAAEPRLRALLGRFAHWPMHPIWVALIDAELEADRERAVEAWRRAVDAVDDPRALRLLQPYARLRLGEAELEIGERQAAKVSLQAAHDQAEQYGIGAVLASVVRVATAAGLLLEGGGAGRATGVTDAVAAATDATAELTARERQVLALIAEGLSNRQIGERLFISGKTASVHVSAILRKLGAATRTEAVYRAGLATSASPGSLPTPGGTPIERA
ncbi:AAA family ATPase [Agromyces mediolanus]|uniref:helix-turn-helix transcriptional regulator n=1 Tax=Agromyces mediolanus TaxID=41986 RepID=UPI00203DC6F9|nr:AAA family ATPase [Agromyces mediolanus]MCM3658344.1 AAA family ATPase [Agromyces mediolanus]